MPASSRNDCDVERASLGGHGAARSAIVVGVVVGDGVAAVVVETTDNADVDDDATESTDGTDDAATGSNVDDDVSLSSRRSCDSALRVGAFDLCDANDSADYAKRQRERRAQLAC